MGDLSFDSLQKFKSSVKCFTTIYLLIISNEQFCGEFKSMPMISVICNSLTENNGIWLYFVTQKVLQRFSNLGKFLVRLKSSIWPMLSSYSIFYKILKKKNTKNYINDESETWNKTSQQYVVYSIEYFMFLLVHPFINLWYSSIIWQKRSFIILFHFICNKTVFSLFLLYENLLRRPV